MTIILTSILQTHCWDDCGNRHPIKLEDTNLILTNIKTHVKKFDKFVYVANDRYDHADNDAKLQVVCDSFNMTGIGFKENVVIDERNKNKARTILQSADLIVLSGGKCLRQLDFFKDMRLDDILKDYDGVVIGVSAGAMNLCKTVANFPEDASDIEDPRWLNGLGFFGGVIIPHFDGINKIYQIPCENEDVVNSYILPMSRGREFIGLPNGSYILIHEGKATSYGKMYSISSGVIKCAKLCCCSTYDNKLS